MKTDRPKTTLSPACAPDAVPGGPADGACGGSLPVTLSNIPAELRKPCVAWRAVPKRKADGTVKIDKVPMNARTGGNASSTDPATWGTAEQALDWIARTGTPGGIGHVFTGSGVVGIDLDHCVNADGQLDPEAAAIVKLFEGSYTELSPSGDGVHIIVAGTLPGVTSDKAAPGIVFPFGIEFFHDRYFLTLTGKTPDGCGPLPVLPKQAELDKLFARVQAAKQSAKQAGGEVEKFEREIIATLADLRPGPRTAYTTADGRTGFKWVLGQCVNGDAHSTGAGGAAVLYIIGSGPGYVCQHSHCAELGWNEFAKARGLRWDRRAFTSGANGKGGGRPPMDPAGMAADFVEATCAEFEILTHRGTWYEYRSARGWGELPEDELEKRVMTFLSRHPTHATHARTNAVREIIAHLATFTMNALPAAVELPARLKRDAGGAWTGTPCPNEVAFKAAGGGFECRDLWATAEWIACLRETPPEARPADSTFFSLDWVPYEFRQDLVTRGDVDIATHAPAFARYVEYALDERERDALRRLYGLALVDCTKYEVFWFLFGRSGREGKTVSMDVLRGLLGRRGAVSYVDLAKVGDRFQAWPLAHSKVNLCGDMNSVEGGELRQIEGLFKDLVSGGSFEYERKNDDKRDAKCRARFIFAGNTLPEFMDRSDAVWERLRILNFPRAVPVDRRDPDLADRIVRGELSTVLAWALLGLADVLAAGRVEDTPTGKTLKKDLRRVCDHEQTFFEDAGYIKDPAGRVASGAFYADYRTWTLDNGFRPLGSSKFLARLRTLTGGYETPGKDPITRKSVRQFVGVSRREG